MNAEIDINSRKSIASMIYLVVVSVSVFIIQPGIVQGFVSELGLSPEQAGYVASAEMWGLAVTTVFLIYFAERIDWRKITIASLSIAVAGNVASTLNTDLQTFTLIRAITGLGLGAMISLPFAMLGMTKKTDYNFGLAIVCLLAYGAIVLFLIPMVLASIGLDGIFVFLAIFCGVGFLTVPYIPRGARQSTDQSGDGENQLHFQKRLALAGMLAFNIAIGAVWAYLFLVGTDAGIEEQGVANVLTISQFLGMLGALLVVLLSSKINRGAPLCIAILSCAVGIGTLLLEVDFFIYSLGVYIFNFFWNVCQPYLFANLAAFNDNSKTVIRGSCMQMLGFAIGPYIAATIVGDGVSPSYATVNLFGVVLFLVSLALMLPAIIALRGRR